VEVSGRPGLPLIEVLDRKLENFAVLTGAIVEVCRSTQTEGRRSGSAGTVETRGQLERKALIEGPSPRIIRSDRDTRSEHQDTVASPDTLDEASEITAVGADQ
jgi:hypothetical protein